MLKGSDRRVNSLECLSDNDSASAKDSFPKSLACLVVGASEGRTKVSSFSQNSAFLTVPINPN